MNFKKDFLFRPDEKLLFRFSMPHKCDKEMYVQPFEKDKSRTFEPIKDGKGLKTPSCSCNDKVLSRSQCS
jgi:hypothetical protein